MQPFAINTYGHMLSHSARACLEHLAAVGYRAFELMMHPGHLWPAATDGAARRELRRFVEAGELRLVSLNMPNIDLNLAAVLEEVRYRDLPMLEIIDPDPDRAIRDSVARLIAMGWPAGS